MLILILINIECQSSCQSASNLKTGLIKKNSSPFLKAGIPFGPPPPEKWILSGRPPFRTQPAAASRDRGLQIDLIRELRFNG
jgi:hypothetical protein